MSPGLAKPVAPAASQSKRFIGRVLPAVWGYGHSRGYAKCIHWWKSRPLIGTSPSWLFATAHSRCFITSLSRRPASTVAEGSAATTERTSSGDAVGAARLASTEASSGSHSLMPQTSWYSDEPRQDLLASQFGMITR